MPLLTCTTSSGPPRQEVGDQLGVRTFVRDENDVLTDTTMEWTLVLPDGTTTSGIPTHIDVGQYLTTFPVFTQSGIYRWQIKASGLINQVEQGRFRVDASLV